MEKYIPIIKGLISYHERMTAPMEAVKCEADCPVVIAENDLYLGALKAALVLMEREVGRRDMEANDTSTVNIDLCISVLENLRNRSQLYATMFPHLTDDYLAELVNTEHTAIDAVISILKNQEK